MAPRTLAYVSPEVLRWARESSGLTLESAARKIQVADFRLLGAEEGEDQLTLREAERAADLYGRPLALLFAPEPPFEEPQEVQFRRLPGAPDLPWSPEMVALARRVTERQEAARELYDELEEAPPWVEAATRFARADQVALSPLARSFLGVTAEDRRSWTDRYAALRAWREAVEALGVLVMQDGSTDPAAETRGFASTSPSDVPAIVVNSQEDARARAFTIIHELGHLVLAARGERMGEEATEVWCNDFAGEVVVPRAELDEVVPPLRNRPPTEVALEVARTFGVTPLAAAVRIVRAGMVPAEDGPDLIAQLRASGSESESERPKGGNYYRNQVTGFGAGYVRLVFAALDSRVVTYPTASALLDGVKVQNFDRLRAELGPGGA